MKHLLLSIAALTLGCQSPIPSWLDVPDTTTKNGVEVVVSGVVRSSTWISAITGTATNNSGAPLSRCRVSFKAYGMQGGMLGTASADRLDMDVGETWKFEAKFSRKIDKASALSAPTVVATH